MYVSGHGHNRWIYGNIARQVRKEVNFNLSEYGKINCECFVEMMLVTTTVVYFKYLYNRQGKCTFAIYYTDYKHRTRELQTCVRFNTAPDNGGTVPREVRDYYRSQRVRYCETADMDPLDNCRPVDCLMKYSARKNYFNEKCKLCQRAPVCVSQRDDADVVSINHICISNNLTSHIHTGIHPIKQSLSKSWQLYQW